MATYNEPVRPLEFLISEANGQLSREQVTLAASQGALVAGTVLGKKTKAGTASAAAFSGNTGNGTMGSITVGAGAKVGVYKLVMIEPGSNVGTFTVEDPDGVIIGRGAVASAFSAGGLAFTLADGATDFIAGDGFDITVAAGANTYAVYDNTATDGSEVAVAVLAYPVDNVAATQSVTVIERLAEVKYSLLNWGSNDSTGITAGKADLLTKLIQVRA